MSMLLALGRWAENLRLEHAPEGVQRRLRLQAASVLGAAAESVGAEEIAPVLAVARGMGSGPFRVAPGVNGLGLEGALMAGSALSMAHDHDDWMLCAHAGHSAVWASWLGAAELGLPWERALTAQLAANEISARLGGVCLAGRQNGQAWSYLHAVSGALVGGLLRGLSGRQLAEAMGLALAQAPHVDWSLFRSGGKVLTASRPLLDGWRLAALVEAGVRGPVDVLEPGSDFLEVFASGRPLRGWMTGLDPADPAASSWLTWTLSIKTVPGCAYLSTSVEALREVRRELEEYEGHAIGAEDVLRVDVDAGLLTTAMERLLGASGPLTPVAVTFSVRLSLAVLLLAGELTARQLSGEWLREHEEAVRSLADRIHLHHDWRLTVETWNAMRRSLAVDRLLAGIGPGPLLAAATRGGGLQGGLQAGLALTEVPLAMAGERIQGFDTDELPELLSRGLSRLSGLASRGMERLMNPKPQPGPRRFDLADHDLSTVTVPLPARVRVLLHGGHVREAEVRIARGSPGRPVLETEAATHAKLTEGLRAAGEPDPHAAADALLVGDLPGDGPAAVVIG